MNFLRGLVREHALIVDLVETVVVGLLAFGIGLTGDQQTYIVATAIGVLGLIKAFLTVPFAPAAVTDLGRAVLCLLMSFGVGLTADQIAVSVTLLGLVTTAVLRAQVSPKYDRPVADPTGAGAGPVASPTGGVLGDADGHA